MFSCIFYFRMYPFYDDNCEYCRSKRSGFPIKYDPHQRPNNCVLMDKSYHWFANLCNFLYVSRTVTWCINESFWYIAKHICDSPIKQLAIKSN